MLKEAQIGSIILENPFYGLRKPKDQRASSLQNVSDIFVMGGCLILECLVLLHWCERNGFGPLGVTGLSMGGHMASLAATNWPKPLVLVPCLSWSTASTVFTEGVMSQSINWDVLETQYFADGNYRERLSKMVTVVDDAFKAGQCFVKNFMKSVQELKRDIKEMENFTCTASSKDVNLEVIRNLSKTVEESTFLYESSKSNTQLPSSALNKLNEICIEKHEQTNAKRINWWEHEALQFMRGMMDECTHLKNFSVPYDTSLIIAICAKEDAYVPREGCASLEEIWPGAEIRYLDAGHVSAYVKHQKIFRLSIAEAFSRAKIVYEQKKYRQNHI